MQLSSISSTKSPSEDNTKTVAQLERQLGNLQKQLSAEYKNTDHTAKDKQKIILLLQQQIQMIQMEIRQLLMKGAIKTKVVNTHHISSNAEESTKPDTAAVINLIK